MRNIQKWAKSWWGRCLIGAFIGGLLVAFSGLNDPTAFVWGMALGALAMFFLGRLT
jgi:hypothetical protein